jgi:hypothetical protein
MQNLHARGGRSGLTSSRLSRACRPYQLRAQSYPVARARPNADRSQRPDAGRLDFVRTRAESDGSITADCEKPIATWICRLLTAKSSGKGT